MGALGITTGLLIHQVSADALDLSTEPESNSALPRITTDLVFPLDHQCCVSRQAFPLESWI